MLLMSKPSHLIFKLLHLFLKLFEVPLNGPELMDLCDQRLVSNACQHVVNMLRVVKLGVEDVQLVGGVLWHASNVEAWSGVDFSAE